MANGFALIIFSYKLMLIRFVMLPSLDDDDDDNSPDDDDDVEHATPCIVSYQFFTSKSVPLHPIINYLHASAPKNLTLIITTSVIIVILFHYRKLRLITTQNNTTTKAIEGGSVDG